ncbi:MAG: metal ABC transporter permease [Patescibacteria group bacterium]
MSEIFSIFQYDFMIRAMIAGICIAVIAPVIGIFLVVRRYAVMADTLAHVSLVGIAAAILTGAFAPVTGAIIVSLIASVGIEEVRTRQKLYGESVLALFLSGSLAIAVILVGLARGKNVNFSQYLFGSITTVNWHNVILMLVFTIIVIAVTVVSYRRLFLTAFDEELAKAGGINIKTYNILSLSFAAITVSLATQVVGALLVGALMVIPTLTAMQLKRNFRQTMILAALFAFLSVVIGLVASFYLNLASGATIVIVALILFIISIFISKSS